MTTNGRHYGPVALQKRELLHNSGRGGAREHNSSQLPRGLARLGLRLPLAPRADGVGRSAGAANWPTSLAGQSGAGSLAAGVRPMTSAAPRQCGKVRPRDYGLGAGSIMKSAATTSVTDTGDPTKFTIHVLNQGMIQSSSACVRKKS
jgi:hypothetical protein